MPRAILEWEGREYEHNPKSADWYWAVGIVATALLIAAILFESYLLAVLVVVAAIAVALHAAKHPPVHRFVLTDQGIIIDQDLHTFDFMDSFSVLEHIHGNRPPLLSIKTSSWLTPHLMIPLYDVDADEVYAYLLERIDEGEHRHSLSDVVAAWLGF